jgi:hypothetical protein
VEACRVLHHHLNLSRHVEPRYGVPRGRIKFLEFVEIAEIRVARLGIELIQGSSDRDREYLSFCVPASSRLFLK